MEKNYTLFPLNQKYITIWSLYKKALASFWTVEEIDLSKDKDEARKLFSKSLFEKLRKKYKI